MNVFAPRPPALADLLARHLRRPDSLRLPAESEVEPYQAMPPLWMEPHATWADAVAAAAHLLPHEQAVPFQESCQEMPPAWPKLFAGLEPGHAIPFCLGNAPQLLRDLAPLLLPQGDRLTLLPPSAGVGAAANLDLGGDGSLAGRLLHAAALRLQGRYPEAGPLLAGLAAEVPPEARDLVQNEMGALAWHAGWAEEAELFWSADPDSANPVFLFNRGLAALCRDDRIAAQPLLRAAVRQLPDLSAWRHLGQLYLAAAELN